MFTKSQKLPTLIFSKQSREIVMEINKIINQGKYFDLLSNSLLKIYIVWRVSLENLYVVIVQFQIRWGHWIEALKTHLRRVWLDLK